jgi:actin-like ATPase involved in cell morphogenesis
MHQAITITYGDQAENHVGMQTIGVAQPEGITEDEMKAINEVLMNLGMRTEIVCLSDV